jgi:hypothetical protein
MDEAKFSGIVEKIQRGRLDLISDADRREAIDYSAEIETAWHQLTYLAPRLFPEVTGDTTDAELWQLICGHCAFHHGMTAGQVREMPIIELVGLLSKDLKGPAQAAALASRGEPSIDLVSYNDLALLAGVETKTLSNRLRDYRPGVKPISQGKQKFFHWRQIGNWMRGRWPGRILYFPDSFEEVQQALRDLTAQK